MFHKLQKAILSNEVIILPTDTVYGIASLPENEGKLNKIKLREHQPSARVYYSKEQLFNEIKLDQYLTLIVERLLPGPFTLLLPHEGKKIGVRIPEHHLCLDFLRELDRVVVMTSANLHKEIPPTSYTAAKANFPHLQGLDGGVCKYAKPSAIIDLSEVIR